MLASASWPDANRTANSPLFDGLFRSESPVPRNALNDQGAEQSWIPARP